MSEHTEPKESERVVYHTCPLCEATCGLEFTMKGDQVIRIRGDKDDVFSKGYSCPKGRALGELHNDPDRLKRPMVRTGDTWKEVSWDEAFEAVEKGLLPLIGQYGNDAVALYLGNPNSHTMAASCFLAPLIKSMKTKNFYSSSSVDQMPKQVSSGLMFGHDRTVAVPDIDRTDYLLILGANPFASNGSLCTAPNFPGRLHSLKERGGKLVVIDPCRTQTAQIATEHHFIRPGSDALFLFALVHVLFKEKRVALGRLADHITGFDEVKEAAKAFSPEAVEAHCGIDKETIHRIAMDLADADSAAVYGRMGTCVVEFGGLANWLVDVLNVLTGNLDRDGGAMFPMAAHVPVTGPSKGRGFKIGRWKSRVKGLPEAVNELPSATLCDEIETPGDGQIKALITVAANPVISNPNSLRLDKALASLDFMVAVDFYLNESNRHAHVILPPTSPLSHSQYDFFFYSLSVRNIVNFSKPVIPRPDGEIDKWMILAKLTALFQGLGAGCDPGVIDDAVLNMMVGHALKSGLVAKADMSSEAIVAMLDKNRGPDRMLDFLLRIGPYGDQFGEKPQGLSLETLMTHPHGIDLGPLKPRIPEVLSTASGKIELAPEPMMSDIARLRAYLQKEPEKKLVLISRRHLRSNNGWFHNLPGLLKGKNRCTMQINPDDAAERGLQDGGSARVSSDAGEITVPVEISQDMMKGVVSIPHGWGHDLPGIRLAVAAANPGVNSNILADETKMDALTGNALLNGIPVNVAGVS